jgi:hypothetical protein
MRVTVSFMLLLLGCGHPTRGPLEGAWLSNRDLTLYELREARNWTPEQWQKLSSPEFFGHMLYVFHGGHAITVFDALSRSPWMAIGSTSRSPFSGAGSANPSPARTSMLLFGGIPASVSLSMRLRKPSTI